VARYNVKMDTVKKLFVILLLGCCVALVIQTIVIERELAAAALDLGRIGDGVHAEAKALRADVLGELGATREGVLAEVHGLITGALRVADAGRVDLKAVLDERGVVIDEQLRVLGSRSSKVLEDTDKAVIKADVVMAQVQESSELLLDCDGNPQCFPNRAIGTMQAVEGFADAGRDAMVEVKRATPEILADAEKVSGEMAIMAQKGAEASGESAEVMRNLRKQTQPLPLVLRLGSKFALPAIGYIVGTVF